MNVYWYWPFVRREELGLAAGVVRPGDELLVHGTERATDPVATAVPGCTVVAALPNVPEQREHSPAWLASRMTTYARRARIRARTVRSRQVDVCHVMYLNRFTDPVALRALQRHTALVSTVHDVVPHQRRLPEPVERAALRALYGGAGTLVVHHRSVRDRLVSEFGVDAERVFLVPHQVPEFDGLPLAAADHPTPEPLPGPVVLFFGAFRRNKGIDVLLDAIRGPGVGDGPTFVFAGRGAPELEAHVATAAARHRHVHAEIGFVTGEHKHELFSRADLVVLPYTSFASQSGVLHDAYAHGVPVVVTEVGALGETVREDGTGWVVAPGDAEALAAAIGDALEDGAARARAADAAAATARARRPVLVGRQLRAVYEHVLGTT